MRTNRRYFVSCAIVLGFMLFLLACDRGPHLVGLVRDGGGAPLAGVHVVLTATGYSKSEGDSGSDGTYSVRLPEGAPDDIAITLKGTKPGLLDFERHLTLADVKKEGHIDFVMIPGKTLPQIMQMPSTPRP